MSEAELTNWYEKDTLCPICMFDPKNGGHCDGPEESLLPCGNYRPSDDCIEVK